MLAALESFWPLLQAKSMCATTGGHSGRNSSPVPGPVGASASSPNMQPAPSRTNTTDKTADEMAALLGNGDAGITIAVN